MKKLGLVFMTFAMLSCSFTNSDNKPLVSPQKPVDGQSGENGFPSGYNPNAGPFSEEKMLANIGLNVIAPATSTLRLQSEILQMEISKAFAAAKNNGSARDLNDAQAAWKKTMLAYHFLSGVPVGPMSHRQLGLLGEKIYSWPYMNLCGVDNQVVARADQPTTAAPELFTLKGLAVLEYLLFEQTLGSTCNPNNIQNKKVIEWVQTKTPAQKKLDRLQYAHVIVQDLVEQTKKLEAFWSPQGRNFSKTLVDGSFYPSIKEAINAVSDSLFSLETAKDLRMAKPLGLHKECSGKCAQYLEHAWSKISLEAIEAQAQGFDAAFAGRGTIDGYGFDDYLKTFGRQDVASHIQDSLSTFLQSLREAQALGTLSEQIETIDHDQCKATTRENRLVPVCAAYQDLRQVTTKLKTEFLTALSLRAPPSHQGDND